MSYRVRVKTNEHLPDGTPIVRSHQIEGVVTEGDTPAANAEIRIIEPVVHDEGSGTTDEDGFFSIRIHEDTMHHIFVNGIDSQLVKVITR